MIVNMTRQPRAGSGDGLKIWGSVEILAYSRGKLFDHQKYKNIVLYQGASEVIRTLSVISPSTAPRLITRMAVGDQGTIPADPTVPKVPTKDLTSLYHEVYRKDIDSRTLTTSSTTNDNNTEFVAVFDAADVALTAFSNPSQPRLNEVGLILIDPVAAAGLVRTPVTAPATPPSDEVVMTLRAFKSVPFEVANDVSVTIRYGIFIE